MMLIFAMTTLLVAPWKGADLATATTAALKYRLTIEALPATVVHLRATHVAGGWIAAFCDARVCSPGEMHETIPASGSIVLQFELIREEDSAPRTSGAVIETDDGPSVTIPAAPAKRPRAGVTTILLRDFAKGRRNGDKAVSRTALCSHATSKRE